MLEYFPRFRAVVWGRVAVSAEDCELDPDVHGFPGAPADQLEHATAIFPLGCRDGAREPDAGIVVEGLVTDAQHDIAAGENPVGGRSFCHRGHQDLTGLRRLAPCTVNPKLNTVFALKTWLILNDFLLSRVLHSSGPSLAQLAKFAVLADRAGNLVHLLHRIEGAVHHGGSRAGIPARHASSLGDPARVIKMPKEVTMTVQDRAYTSPIWYTP